MIDQLILVRHGETVHNAAGIAQGWNDSALSSKGEAQVRALAKRLRGYGADALYSSPLGRAMSTAKIIADEVGMEIRSLDGLREMSYGEWEGKSYLELRQHEVYERWLVDPDCACPGGESHTDLHTRLAGTFPLIDAKRPIVVAHGTAIRVSATVLMELPVMTSRHFAQDNAALNIFVRRGPRMVLKVWNDTTHCGECEY